MNHLSLTQGRYSSDLFISKVNASSSKLSWVLLAQVALCVVPAMGLVGLGSPAAGAKWFYGVTLMLFARFLLMKDRLGFVSLTVSSIPVLMLLRNFFYHSAPIALLAFGIILWFFTSPKEFSQLWKDLSWKSLFILAGLYWLSSYILTGEYFVNLRVLESVFSAASIYLLAKHREYLATALIGVGISVFSVGLAFLQYSEDRLGHGVIDGYALGNPMTVGIPLALIFLLSIADNGKWLLLEKHRYWRLALGLASSAFLMLSTSRGSWAIVIVNVIVILLIGRRSRGMLLASIALLVLTTLMLLGTQRGPSIVRFYERTFGTDRTMSQRSSGRSDQWEIFPQVFQDSPIWGFGPGSGKSVYGRYSTLEDNEDKLQGNIAWHSLYLQVAVEAGIIGIILLTLLLAPLLFRGFIYWRLYGSSLPLNGILGFLVVGLSVSGFDAASGMFLGLGFLSIKTKTTRRFIWEHDGKDLVLQSLSPRQTHELYTHRLAPAANERQKRR